MLLNRFYFPLLLSLLLLLLSCSDRADEVADIEKRLSALEEKTGKGEHDEQYLLNTMDAFQRYMSKLWFSGKAVNGPLIHFYHHEIEETLEALISKNVVDDDKNISDLARQMALPAVEYFEELDLDKDTTGFHEAYIGMVKACNNCHLVTEHAEIKITIPERPFIDNQIFTVEE